LYRPVSGKRSYRPLHQHHIKDLAEFAADPFESAHLTKTLGQAEADAGSVERVVGAAGWQIPKGRRLQAAGYKPAFTRPGQSIILIS